MGSNDNAYDAARFKRAGRGRIYDSIIDTIGDTPLIRLPRLSAADPAQGRGAWPSWSSSTRWLVGQGPHRRVADRGAWKPSGVILKPGATIVEPTSGNTGIALAFVAAAKGYQADPGHAREHVDRAAQDAAAAGRQAGTDARPRSGMRGAVARAQETDRGHPRRGHAAAVRERRQPADPPGLDRRGDLERHRTARWTPWCPASAPAAPLPASARC